MTTVNKILTVSLCLACLTACAPAPGSDNTNSQNPPASKSDSYDPCNLLTAADVQAAFPGGIITLTHHDTEPNPAGLKTCFYSASETDQKFAQLAIVNVKDAPSGIKQGSSLKPLYDSEKNLLQPSDVQEITGLGDEAYYGGSGLKLGAGLHVLDVAHGVELNLTVGLGFGNTDQPAHIKMEKEMAEKVLSRL